MIENIISGFIGGLLVLIAQYVVEVLKRQKKEKADRTVGNKKLKIIASNFIYAYEPHKISIEKVIDDFGTPLKVYEDDLEGYKLKIYQYNFQNAKVLFSKSRDSSDIISITLFSTHDKDNPVLCRMSFADDDIEMGKAKINQTIIEDCMHMQNSTNGLGNVCRIKSRYFYRQIKHLTFAYEVDGSFDRVEETKDSIINQVCVSQMDNVTPFFSFYDTFYN